VAAVITASVAMAFALYFGREFFVPIALAILLNALLRPVVRLLERARLPTPAGAAIVILVAIVALVVICYSLARPIQNWMKDAPQKLEVAQEKLTQLRRPIQQVSDAADKIQRATQGATSQPAEAPAPQAPPMVARFLGTTTKLLGAAVEVFLLAYLLLAAGDLFLQKLIKVVPLARDKVNAVRVVHESEGVVLRYLLVTALINAGQAVLVGLALWLLKMPNPLLWALFTFALEFIPYLGGTLMVALLSITAFATFDSLGHILMVPGAYLLITTIQNNVVSPIAYGNGMKLNPVAVFIAVILWWFLWGIPGAFLAVPITATIKIICDRTNSAVALGEFLGE
jgi:predicted PurR-regulated permease PerM